MTAEVDDELQLMRASAGLLSDLQVALSKLLWKRGAKRVHQLVRTRDLDHVIQLVEPFQAEPQLLDTHLKILLPPIVEAYLAFLQISQPKSTSAQTVPLDVAASKLLYTFCKVRGEKIIIGFLNNEPRYLELILSNLEDFKTLSADSDTAWEKSYISLLWLTHLMLVPFDLSSISRPVQLSEGHEHMSLQSEVPSIARRVIALGIYYLASATREQDAAAKMLVRLVTRPDMQSLKLPAAVVSWALTKLLNPSASPNSNLHTFLGPLRFLVGMTVSVDTTGIASLIPSIYSAGKRLMDDAMLAFLSSSAVTKKLVVKLLRNVALLSLQSSFDNLVDFFEASSVVEETIEYGLQSLEDRDTPVRFAASKALSMIVLRLDPEMGHEVVQAVLDSFNEDMPARRSERPDFGAANALRWHGLTLTLAHALFRRSASPQQLPEILNALLLALSFEQRSAVGVSTGSNVRDAACFGIWSLSRRYTTKELLSADISLIDWVFYEDANAASIIQIVAVQLLLSACLDPSGNIRRGSSAALQELTGRHPDQVSNGISLVQVVDYHAVGLRQRAMVDVAQNAADLDPMYRKALLTALGQWRGLGSTDVSSREAAAESIGLLCAPQTPQHVTITLVHLQRCLDAFPGSDIEQCHGSMLALSKIIDNKILQQTKSDQPDPSKEGISYLLALWGLFIIIDVGLFRSHTARAIRAELPSAVARLIASLSELSLLPTASHWDLPPQKLKLSQIVSGLISSSESSTLQVLPRLVRALSLLSQSGLTTTPILDLSDCLTRIAHDSSGMVLQGSGRVVALGAAFPWLQDIYSCDPIAACNLLSNMIQTAPLTEWRIVALHAMELMIQAGAVGTDVLPEVLLALDAGLNDYTITERGDVGSLVRTKAVQCVQGMWEAGQPLLEPASKQLLQGNIIRLAPEKMDRVRIQAARCLARISGLESASDMDVTSYQYFANLFSPLNHNPPAWKRDAILKGSISCAGVGAEGLLRASRMALVDTISRGSTDMRSDCLSTLTSFLRELIAKEAETQPLLELIAYLLDTLPSIIPSDSPFNMQYREWSKIYGDVYQIQLGNIPVIVCNSAESARVLFGHFSQALSSRPVFYTFHKVLSNTAGTTIGTSPFSESLKRRRKGAASALNKPSVASYVDHLDVETLAFVKEGLEYGAAGTQSVDPMPMIQRLSLSLALTLNWGTRMGSRDDPLFHEITEVEEEISKFRSTSGNLQDYVPFLRLNPFSVGSKRAKEMRQRRDVYLTKLNKDLDDRMEKGTHKPCIQANVIQDKEAKLNKEELTSISLTMLSGGLDTVTTLVAWSIALLGQRPDIQEKAISEIRKMYGEDEILCAPEDDMKYYTVLRLALPRATVKDITYEGKLIPAGTTVYLNAWACNMDPAVWKDAEVFRPERWIEQPDAPLFTYGVGYRMCAGSLLANRELYLVFMRMLSSFEIQKGTEVETHPVKGSSDPTSLVCLPHRYEVKFRPRNEVKLREQVAAREKIVGEC
ncbi:hypothetical protein E4T52_11608 [Aureobasidium sp. EXF-3400]|nr:hypothetical protein E4T51_10622 [Aureobasidium sp. EXF-12344]KAI4773412.1 hypothetical protein E4T52_11608 [Aureobasidium sp. EXF-3400]